MGLSGKMKGVIGVLIGIFLIFSLLGSFMTDLMSSAENITATEDVPTMVSTLANLWWLPIALVLVGVITTAFVRKRGGGRRFWRRRR